jgi:hypothetical protein
MRRGPGMRTLGEVFEEAMREQSEARGHRIPKRTHKLIEVFDETKQGHEEAWWTIRGKRTYEQRHIESAEARGQSSGIIAKALDRIKEPNRQNMLRIGLEIRTSAEVFDLSEREYKERKKERRKKQRTKINREIKDAETSEPRQERSES